MEFDDFDDEVLVHQTARLSEFEDMVIKGLLSVDSFCNVAINLIKPEYFDDNYNSLIFNKIKEFYNISQGSKLKVPQKDILKTIIKEDDNFIKRIGGDLTFFLNKIDTLYESVVIDDIWLTERCEKWLKEKAIKDSIYTLVDKAQSAKNIDKDISNSIPDLQDALTLTLSPPEIYDFSDYNTVRDVLVQLSQGTDLLKLSSKTMTDILGDNSRRGSLCMLAGGTGGGKSTHLLNFAKWYSDMGNNVLYVSYELEIIEIYEKYMSLFLNVKKSNLRTESQNDFDGFDTSIKEKHSMLHTARRGATYFVKYNPYKQGMKEIDAYLKILERTKNKKIDVVIIDYLGEMYPSYVKINENTAEHTRLVAVSKEMKHFAGENQLLVWTAMQLNPASDQNETIGKADLAQSKQVSFVTSFMYGFIPSKDKTRHKCYPLKMRSSADRGVFLLGADLDYQRIYDVDQSEIDVDSDDIEILKEFITTDVPRDYKPYKANEQKKQKPKFSLNL